MNKIKAIFANRKFSLEGLILVIMVVTTFIGLIVAFMVIDWLATAYPAETGVCIACVFVLTLGGLMVVGLIDAIFPKRCDSEVDDWIYRAKAELKKHNKEIK